ncbi:hypothetical protein CPB84DRAFT_872878 [Gymnopilus junonius]|uniref:Protein kinase domain-containing protein n=1 Tax=Gymnopilus junonius TaxID=109634 RepID=A0A9P5NMB4_GYMJU|nr:hypothetical protein CPB84DRAFT_872878 [Gymnopilus junonius]
MNSVMLACRLLLLSSPVQEKRTGILFVTGIAEPKCVHQEILQSLNFKRRRPDSINPATKVVEFLEFQDFCFAVVLCSDARCGERPFRTAFECLDFAEQILWGLSYLHSHFIAHMDISTDSISVNYYDESVPPTTVFENAHLISSGNQPHLYDTFSTILGPRPLSETRIWVNPSVL